MLDIKLKSSYELLGGKSLKITKDQLKGNSLYERTSVRDEYERYLSEVFLLARYSQKRFFDTVKNFLLDYTVCRQVNHEYIRYNYTDSKIVINIPDSVLSTIPQILGAPLFYVSAILPTKRITLAIPRLVNILTYLITKSISRPIELEELSPIVIQVLVGWFLKQYDALTLENLSAYSLKANRSFLSSVERRKVYDTIKEIESVNELFDFLQKQLSSTMLKQTFISRFGIDVTLSFEDLRHLYYSSASANLLKYPSTLYQYLKSFAISGDVDAITTSVATNLIHKLP